MNAKTAHIILEIVAVCMILSSAITAQPQFQNAHWVPITLGILGVIASIGKSLVVGNIDATGDQQTGGVANKPTTPTGLSMIIIAFLLSLILVGGTACTAPTSTNSTVVAIENPNNEAKIVQGGVQIGATASLAKNPSYKGELVAAADALIAASASNPSGLSGSDISAILAKTSISTVTQNEVASYATSALGLFEADFTLNFPTLKPNYGIFLIAVADGLYTATGNGTKVVALPVIPWPPVTAVPAATPVGGSTGSGTGSGSPTT